MIDYVRALQEIYEPPFGYTNGNSYEKLQATWTDSRPLPPKEELEKLAARILLADAEKQALVAIDRKVEEWRGEYITLGGGQALAYLQKEREAELFLAAENPDITDFPFLSAEVGTIAETPKEAAEQILTKAAEWRKVGALLEAERLAAKANVRQATSPTAKIAAARSLQKPSLRSVK